MLYCPSDIVELVEAYCMGTLPPADAIAFEQHYIGCPRCAIIVEDTHRFIRGIRAAALDLFGAETQSFAAGPKTD